MRSILVEGRRAGGPVYYVHVGDLNWWLFYLDPDFENRLYLWENEHDGKVLGWILFSLRFRAFDVFVDPNPSLHEQRKRLFLWAEERMRRMVRVQGGQDLSTMWVSACDSQLVAHLESRGFARSDDHILYMQRPLDQPVSEPPLPPGYCLRRVAGEHEVEQRAIVSHAAFESTKPFERYTQGTLRFIRSSVYTPDLDVVAVAPDGQFAEFCICWMDEANQVGHLEPVGTHPRFRRKGLGAAVVSEGLQRMKARGMTAAGVCVESGNRPAQRLYESVGFRGVLRIDTYVKGL